MIDLPRMVIQCVKLQSAAAKKRVGSERSGNLSVPGGVRWVGWTCFPSLTRMAEIVYVNA